MQTSSWRGARRKLSPRGLAVLTLFVATAVLAVTATDAPPKPPQWLGEPSGAATSFNLVPAEFLGTGASARVNLRFVRDPNTPAADVSGYRLYLGGAPRAAGAPFSLGDTPYDLGAATFATIAATDDSDAASKHVPLTLSSSAATFLSLTAYNSFGNEGDYARPNDDGSVSTAVVPVAAPLQASLSAAKLSTTSVRLSFAHGVAADCSGCTVRTEIWRKIQGQADSTLARRTIVPLGTTSFDDTGLAEETTYEYAFRTVVNTSPRSQASTPFLVYSAASRLPVSTGQTIVVNVTIPGGAIVSQEVSAANLQAGDQVTINGIGGTVTFNTAPLCTTVSYSTGPNGLARSIYDNPENAFCYGNDKACNDPLPTSGHAGLYMMRNTTRTFIGTAGASFTAGASETLRFGVNDCPATANAGGFSATVTIRRP
jgi:hypothetical protein